MRAACLPGVQRGSAGPVWEAAQQASLVQMAALAVGTRWAEEVGALAVRASLHPNHADGDEERHERDIGDEVGSEAPTDGGGHERPGRICK